MANGGTQEPIFISVGNNDTKHIINLEHINWVQVSLINGEYRSALVVMKSAKNSVNVTGGPSVERLLEVLKPYIGLTISSKVI